MTRQMQAYQTTLAPVAPGASWRPILDGRVAEQALEAVWAIAESLREPPPAWFPPEVAGSAHRLAVENASLAGGKAGLAVFFAYLAQAWGITEYVEKVVAFLNQAVQAVADLEMPPSLFSGFTGVAWAVEHLQGRLLDPAAADDGEAIDEALLTYLDRSPRAGAFDLVSGLVGFGAYALERLPRPTAARCLERVVDRLDEMAEHTPEGITWFTPPAALQPRLREQFPFGCYNLGVAHGVPGVIGLLGEFCASGGASGRARGLLDGAVAWLQRQELTRDEGAGFPRFAGPGSPRVPSKLAWCYGDPAIAAVLLRAARWANEPAWEHDAIRIAQTAAARPPDQAGVSDTGLCHGTAGLGHLFNRLFQATGEPKLQEAARFWLERTLALRVPGQGVAGFAAMTVGRDDKPCWVAEPGILMGGAGIALALLAAVTPLEPAWDRMLLVAIPPRTAKLGN